MEFPKVESTLFVGLKRTHKIDSEPQVTLDGAQDLAGRAAGRPGAPAPTDSRLRYVFQSEIGRGQIENRQEVLRECHGAV